MSKTPDIGWSSGGIYFLPFETDWTDPTKKHGHPLSPLLTVSHVFD